MFKAIIKIMLFFITLISPLLSLAQHHLYFYIPECPNPVKIVNQEILDFTVSPVPANNTLQISFNETIHEGNSAALNIFNSKGKLIFKTNLENRTIRKNQFIIDISQFKQGLYYIQYSDKKSILSKKFLITR